MIIFETTNFLLKKIRFDAKRYLQSFGRKQLAYVLFLAVLLLYYLFGHVLEYSDKRLPETTVVMEQYGQRLEMNLSSKQTDTIVVLKEREHLLTAIEERIVAYLYQMPDYSYMTSLEVYLKYRPELLQQFPSAVPLEKGDYVLSSQYGIRTHPISLKTKKHFGIDLAAPLGKTVYATASGIVSEVIYSSNGYGNHIIIKHRFGFESLYGHLNKILVRKGQKIQQHELIATVGNSGNSTGYHLHYETVKNESKIDPIPSLNLKRNVYAELIEQNNNNHGE
ncbi:M23 family metallopeptidase [uncultured Maribacter sp.]|uniref:M23 family metallopeptidase n=1 Tax=uncultured Maribacter sp. TaxID=431308 RepID=UPI0030DA4CCA|tara:strand:- start:495 stop:1331 length:837 start_codon:yes stop_codon:yes gene_type:complete